jgi:hypothetical protein
MKSSTSFFLFFFFDIKGVHQLGPVDPDYRQTKLSRRLANAAYGHRYQLINSREKGNRKQTEVPKGMDRAADS